MKIYFVSKIIKESYKKDIMELLKLCDYEFIPNLSARSSTTQKNLILNKHDKDGLELYFDNIIKQNNLLAVEENKVIGFMSFKKNYVCEYIDTNYSPNLYITTIIVHPEFRNRGITTSFYEKIKKTFNKYYIFTRTWSTNNSHIRILSSNNFHAHCYLNNDRGEGIDTVYFRYDPKISGIKQYIKQYRLVGNVYFSVFLLIVTIICIFGWLLSKSYEANELYLAFATSLLASFLCLISDTVIKIKDSKNDAFISKFKDFGIKDIHFDKSQVLEKIIPTCREEIWISGYRLIMTSRISFRNALITAAKRSKKLKMKILICPPWDFIYKSTYGEEDATINYLVLFKDLCNCVYQYGMELEIRIATHPIFSDTYKVDERFITGSFLNCKDMYKNTITAKDFFTFDVEGTKNKLYNIYYNDFMSIWNDAVEKMNVMKLYEKIKDVNNFYELTREERVSILLSCCENIIVK